MGITGLLPFLEKASKKANVSEFSGCTVAIDSYCWLHKGAFACAEKLVRGEDTDIHIKYCLKYVTMLLSRNIKPVLVFDGRHLPAKALTESKRRESRDTAKKRAAELLRLGQIEEARSYMRRSVDITHAMALSLIKECRKRNVDCIVAPYEADSQLAYLNVKNIVQLVISEDSDLVLFGCTKVLFKMDLDGNGTLVEAIKLPLSMKCPIERYTFDKFRQMCIMSGCDYLASLPGIGLAKARQFVTTTQDSNFANALKKLPSFFNKAQLTVTDEYRENFLKAEATFKHQFVFDPLKRQLVRLTDPDDEGTDIELCSNAGQQLDPQVAFQLALGNLDPFSLKKMDDWHPDNPRNLNEKIKTDGWKETGISPHPSIWSESFKQYLLEEIPWKKKAIKKEDPIIGAPTTRPRKKVVNLVSRYVPETQDESLSIESLSNMYCVEPNKKKFKVDSDIPSTVRNTSTETNSNNPYYKFHHNNTDTKPLQEADIKSELKPKSPILENKERCYKMTNKSFSVLKRLSKFPRTVLDANLVESKFFNTPSDDGISLETPEMTDDDIPLSNSQKENSPNNSPMKKSPILASPSNRISRNPFRLRTQEEPLSDIPLSEDSVIDNTYPMETLITPVESQASLPESPPKISTSTWKSTVLKKSPEAIREPSKSLSTNNLLKRSNCKVPGLKRNSAPVLPTNQPTLLSKFGFQKKAVLKR